MLNALRSMRTATVVLVGVAASIAAVATLRAQTADLTSASVLATVNGTEIRRADLLQRWREADPASLTRLRQEEYDLGSRILSDLIDEHLVAQQARKRGLTPDGLLAAEITTRKQTVTDADIELLFEQLRPRGSSSITLQQVSAMLASRLEQQRIAEAKQKYLDDLRSAAGPALRIAWTPPRQAVPVDARDPRLGVGQTVEIVEYSDFECPYCKQAGPVLKELVRRYQNHVRIVWRDFPLPSHRGAAMAAEAAKCAADQGQFWAYHDALFANQDGLAPRALEAHASELGLDKAVFSECVSSGRHRQEVTQSAVTGARLGVTSTPTLFINGRMVVGAGPIEKLAKLVEEEIQLARR